MPLFKVVPRTRSDEPVEFEGLDLTSALTIATRKKFLEADLWRDDQLVCTISRDERDSDFWIIAGRSSGLAN